ncbi:MAG: DUF3737 family protein [Bacteroidales bacterium]|nr:DUF3737 family protein [Bacteroidales bacterium]
MQIIENKEFEGERPLYRTSDLSLRNVTIHAGESALKETRNIVADHCVFEGKYPFWITDGFKVTNCKFEPGARAALWYSNDLEMSDTVIDAPKMFRDCNRLNLNNVKITDAQETFWHCNDITLHNVSADNAPYLFMHCENVKLYNCTQNGGYGFQYCKNVEVHNSKIYSKDSFWNSENVTVYDSEIIGEYLAWHSKNVRLVNCLIGETQPLCYCDNLVLENCRFRDDADLAFEYSEVNASIIGNIKSVKNPRTGSIHADSIGEIIIDENIKQPADCKITTGIH